MKKLILFAALFIACLSLSAQNIALDGGVTHAVVVGISDYQDKDIPDLRFAHRDAEAFANFMRSPAGGSLDGDHLKVLTNEQATAGRIAEALDGLIEQAKEGDQVIIYFSGHGDVEGKKISQPGFLLCWDSPSRVYMGGGTYSLAYLQEVVTTLSVQNKVKVTVITDACHAGKLAGSQIGGAQLTSANLAKQYANEVKILSCQPGEFSLEGEQWGGGRGCFSYHLVEALYGFADRNADGLVTIGELDRYLEDHVTAEAAPQSQVPMLLGNKTEQLSKVDAQVLADLKENKSGQVLVFAATESRGLEEEVLAGVDSTVRQMYLAFRKAVKDKRFFPVPAQPGEPQDDCAEHYYAQLSQDERLAPLHGAMRRNYAAALQDNAQQVVNNWMIADPQYLKLPQTERTKRTEKFPPQLERAAELLGEKHYLYRELKARKAWVEGNLSTISIDKQAAECIRHYQEALEWQPEMPLALYGIGKIYAGWLEMIDSAAIYIHRAAAAAPAWVVPYAMMASFICNTTEEFDEAAKYLELAGKIDSTHFLYLEAKADFYHLQKKYAEAEQVLNTIIFPTEKPDSLSGYYMAIGTLALVYMETGRAKQAVPMLRQVSAYDPYYHWWHTQLGRALLQTGEYSEAERAFYEAGLADDPNNPNPTFYSWMVYVYAYQDKMDEAFDALEKAILAGFDEYDWMQVDPDYEKLRAQPERWKALMKKYFASPDPSEGGEKKE